MRRREQMGWVTATVISLAAFSFFAGLGVRAVVQRLIPPAGGGDEPLSYPRVASAVPGVGAETDLRPTTLFLDVLRKLQLYYVEPLPPPTELAYGSVQAMLHALGDPNTRLLSPDELAALQNAAQGEYSGIGAVLTIRSGSPGTINEMPGARPRTITVVSAPPGTPAQKAGLQSGDRITEIDGRWIAPVHLSFRDLTQLTDDLGPQDGPPLPPGASAPLPESAPNERDPARRDPDARRRRLEQATDLPGALRVLLGKQTGRHELTIQRGAPARTFRMPVEFGPTRVDVCNTRLLDGGVGYVQILAFHAGIAPQVREALLKFQQAKTDVLVVDLRSCPGGELEAAVETAALFLGATKFAVLRERDENRRLILRPVFTRGPAVMPMPRDVKVLIDQGTAGSAELFAAAFQEHLGARLIGASTFGDGTEQDIIRLENGAGISITRAQMLTSRGQAFDGRGLKPDVSTTGDALAAALQGGGS